MSGAYLQCLCGKCHELSNVPFHKQENIPLAEIRCEHCGETGSLSYWNPVHGGCPKCGGHLDIDEFQRIFAD